MSDKEKLEAIRQILIEYSKIINEHNSILDDGAIAMFIILEQKISSSLGKISSLNNM